MFALTMQMHYYVEMDVLQYDFEVFTDGSIESRQGSRASWAALVCPLGGGSSACFWGLLPSPSSSNAAELTAVVRGLQSLPDSSIVRVVTDSAFVERAILHPRRGDAHPSLREALSKETARFQRVTVKLVRSHFGIDGNEFVDRVAKLAIIHPELLRDPPKEFVSLKEIK